ncbi:MAG: glycosyltransferase [Muribaculaceae bacterium]|nr:glycosyltransferase [Muribaculaceae bacterium]
MSELDIAICTYKPQGMEKVASEVMPPSPGIRYVVSWQDHNNTPLPQSISSRNDVRVFRYDETGLSNNRNNAINHCESDIVLISDDDLQFHSEAIKKIAEIFKDRPEMDIAVFKIKFPLTKKYPEKEQKLSLPLPKGYYASSVELAFRRSQIGNLRFWPELGLGNSFYQAGEDELFLISAIKRGLNVRFIDLEIAIHPTMSTGDKVSPGILRGQGFIMGILYPFSSLARIPVKAYRNYKSRKSTFWLSLKELGKGYLHSVKKTKTIPHCYRW